MHSFHLSPNILITVKITITQGSVLFLHPFILMCGQRNYPIFRNVAQNVCSGEFTIVHYRTSIGSSGILRFISVFALFMFIKKCCILFRSISSACCFNRNSILQRLPNSAQRLPSTLIEECLSPARFPTWYLSSLRTIYIYIYIYIYNFI